MAVPAENKEVLAVPVGTDDGTDGSLKVLTYTLGPKPASGWDYEYGNKIPRTLYHHLLSKVLDEYSIKKTGEMVLVSADESELMCGAFLAHVRFPTSNHC